MPEKEFTEIFSKRLRYYLNKYDMTQAELAKRLGVGPTSIYNWTNGIKVPRMNKVDAMCEIFHCTRADLINEPPKSEYYLNPETAEVAQKVFENKELRLLFDAAKDSSPEDIRTIHQMLLALKRKEKNE